jgi:hypothetical protein
VVVAVAYVWVVAEVVAEFVISLISQLHPEAPKLLLLEAAVQAPIAAAVLKAAMAATQYLDRILQQAVEAEQHGMAVVAKLVQVAQAVVQIKDQLLLVLETRQQ